MTVEMVIISQILNKLGFVYMIYESVLPKKIGELQGQIKTMRRTTSPASLNLNFLHGGSKEEMEM